MQTLDRVYQKNQNFVFRKIDNDTLLVPIKNDVGDMDCIYNLNEVGAFVWEHLDGEKSAQEIKNLILAEFDVSVQEAEADLEKFVMQLSEIEAIKTVNNSDGEVS
jgi:methyltransferase-like protein